MKNKKYLHYLIAALGFLLGSMLVYYGFELVSIPSIKEYREPVYLLIGIVIAVGSILYAVFKD